MGDFHQDLQVERITPIGIFAWLTLIFDQREPATETFQRPAPFAYDPAGRLYQAGAGGTATRFQYAGDQLVVEYNASGALIRRNIPGLGLDDFAASYDGSGTTNRS